MLLHVTRADYAGNYCLHLSFNDGSEGKVDLQEELDGNVFGPLKDKETFAAFHLDPTLHTVVWPNGADLAPEFLRSLLRVAA